MRQLTIRGIPEEIEAIVKKEAEEKGISLNKAFISLVVKAAGISKEKKKKETIYHDLDSLSGLWTEDEAKIFEKNLASNRKIDKELWKTVK
ncbi:MAG: hypothetical protein M0016_03980 [Deltaproteobacteria bacterium]|nr:hypothetical protein [Deltaproteobacteria bacterium]MCL5879906.1 hypothetical protein [Deltaproteobacteria bacterium]MDA8304307.1 hypothetical protein [Deltaproteobacteria bacterium]